VAQLFSLGGERVPILFMSELPEFTPREKVHASLYKDSAGVFRRHLIQTLMYIVLSIIFMVIWFVSRDPVLAIMGYSLLLYKIIIGLFASHRGIKTHLNVLKKYAENEDDAA
jgi:hypothetical protein